MTGAERFLWGSLEYPRVLCYLFKVFVVCCLVFLLCVEPEESKMMIQKRTFGILIESCFNILQWMKGLLCLLFCFGLSKSDLRRLCQMVGRDL